MDFESRVAGERLEADVAGGGRTAARRHRAGQLPRERLRRRTEQERRQRAAERRRQR